MTRFADIEKALDARWPESRLDPSLDRIAALTALLGDPQHAVPAVHITGTNGKTSTARMVDELLRATGPRTGRSTSPHLQTVRERIVIDGAPISEEGFVAAYETVRPAVESLDRELPVRLSFFEVVTAMAFVAFARAGLDAVVVEVGMGGSWDATNVVDGRVAVVTPISLDHTEYLGPDVASIAREKAGIIKPGSVAVLAAQPEAAELVLRDRCRAVAAEVRGATASHHRGEPTARPDGQTLYLTVRGRDCPGLFLPLLGRYQAENARVALTAVDAFLGAEGSVLSAAQAHRGMSRVRAPGRLEHLRDTPPVLVDASHNPAGMAATVRALRESLAALGVERVVVVLAVLRGKDVDGVVRALDPVASAVVVSQNESPRALPAAELAASATPLLGAGRVLVEARLDDAIDVAVRLAHGPEGRAAVLVTGSVVTAGAARGLIAPDTARSAW
ncbi:folylpolyglutamate synthase/dihydrofolate synthase family protein [Pseudonocardia sp. ICBG1293]|uniref:bifunctional folylpolyglutamate synthase/dihydrofolate synthase n=1 Tax=Pseudonocardia sp. ICBG1293 TaxID=2844382 RepID=UPI001CCD3160|nr:folylpolyglutamate synthase/dihydrofolate synthase family protein [Pseudonocardia sp. ICBG1293]